MQPTDRTAPPVAVAETVARSIEPTIGALQALYRAFQKISIYPPGHPAIPEALAHAVSGLTTALEETDKLVLRVTRDRLWLGDEQLKESTGALRSYALLLHDLGVAAVEFFPGIALDELQTFIVALGRARRDCMRDNSLVALLRQGSVRHLNVVPVDYAALEFAEGARPSDEAPQLDVWESLGAMLTDTDASLEQGSPEELAERVQQELDRHEGTGLLQLRRQMQDVSRELDAAKSDRRAQVHQRLSKFVAALNPKLRQDLLRFDARMGDSSLDLLAELGDVLPETDLLEALQNIDRSGGRVPGQLLTLLNKLLHISRSRPTLASGLRDTLDRWGVPSGATAGDPAELRAALEEVFRRSTKVDCNPEPHQALLDNLARRHIPGRPAPSVSLYRDPCDLDDVQLHTAEMTARLVGMPGGEAHRAGLFRYLGLSLDLLVANCKFAELRDAAVAARTYALIRTDYVQTREAARAFLNAFGDEQRTARIVAQACRGEEFPEPAATLLGLCGPVAIDLAIDTLGTEVKPTVADGLRCFIVAAPPAELQRAVENRLDRGWSALRTVFPILRELPAEEARPVLELLLSHQEFKVRREALLVLHELGGPEGDREAYHRRALEDENTNVVQVAIRCLGSLGSREATDLLGDYVEGSIGGKTPLAEGIDRAAAALIAKGEPGRVRLCGALDRLRSGWRPRTVSAAAAVAGQLVTWAEEPAVAAAVHRWRRSPAGLLRPFLARRRRGGG